VKSKKIGGPVERQLSDTDTVPNNQQTKQSEFEQNSMSFKVRKLQKALMDDKALRQFIGAAPPCANEITASTFSFQLPTPTYNGLSSTDTHQDLSGSETTAQPAKKADTLLDYIYFDEDGDTSLGNQGSSQQHEIQTAPMFTSSAVEYMKAIARKNGIHTQIQ
jgi:hypothetical protein